MGLVSWLSRGTSGLTPEAGAESTGLCVTGGLTPRHTDALPRGHDLCDSEDDTDPPSLFRVEAILTQPSPTPVPPPVSRSQPGLQVPVTRGGL